MALNTYLDINYRDGQNQKRTLTFRIKPLALAAAQTLPAAAKIEAVITAIFSTGSTPSDSFVDSYSVRVTEDVPGETGGGGQSAVSSAARVRNDQDDIAGGWLWSVGGLNKAAVTFDETARNSIVTTGAMWDAIRDALTDAAIAVARPEGAYAAQTTDDIAQSASGFDGRRAAPR